MLTGVARVLNTSEQLQDSDCGRVNICKQAQTHSSSQIQTVSRFAAQPPGVIPEADHSLPMTPVAQIHVCKLTWPEAALSDPHEYCTAISWLCTDCCPSNVLVTHQLDVLDVGCPSLGQAPATPVSPVSLLLFLHVLLLCHLLRSSDLLLPLVRALLLLL